MKKPIPNIKFNSVEELENYEHIAMGWLIDDKPLTKRQQKRAEREFNLSLRKMFGPDAGPDEDVYISDGMYITPNGEIVE